MECYIVGGAVRDQLLGLPVRDRDWVVVGATPEDMIRSGFKPVGKDFPVFLHPQTQEEYALARTERKVAKGYHGFHFYTDKSISLEDDLARRDLTINAMALKPDGSLIDPYHGARDLQAGILRHVSPAFAEDPVRILRIARFAARFGFTVADETLQLIQTMVQNGEVDALVPERVWQELAKALMEKTPSHFFTVLRASHALKPILPEIDALFGIPQHVDYHPEIDTGDHVMRVIDYAASQNYPLPTRFAALTHDLGKALTPTDILPRHIGHEARGKAPLLALCKRLNAPSTCKELALLMVLHHSLIASALSLRAVTLLKLFKKTDALRRPERFNHLLEACIADSRGRLHYENTPYPQYDFLLDLLRAVQKVDAGAIAKYHTPPETLPQAIDEARLNAIQSALKILRP